MQTLLASFNDPDHAKRYGDSPQHLMPGFTDMHRMTAILLTEHAPANARVLVLGGGGGGGLELQALALAHPCWTFVGVDPARAMLDEASRMLGPDAARVAFCEGYIEDAPDGPFDAATCLLMLHFLEIEEPTSTAREPRRRLKPGAPFVTVHSSFPQGKPRAPWLSRYAAFALASGADFEQVEKMRGGGRGRAIAQSGTERSDSAKLISELDFEVNLRFHPTQLPRAAARQKKSRRSADAPLRHLPFGNTRPIYTL